MKRCALSDVHLQFDWLSYGAWYMGGSTQSSQRPAHLRVLQILSNTNTHNIVEKEIRVLLCNVDDY